MTIQKRKAELLRQRKLSLETIPLLRETLGEEFSEKDFLTLEQTERLQITNRAYAKSDDARSSMVEFVCEESKVRDILNMLLQRCEATYPTLWLDESNMVGAMQIKKTDLSPGLFELLQQRDTVCLCDIETNNGILIDIEVSDRSNKLRDVDIEGWGDGWGVEAVKLIEASVGRWHVDE